MKINVFTKDGYDLACALRGPDIEPGDDAEKRFYRLLKLRTAGRLRYLAGCWPTGVFTARPMDPIDKETLIRYGEEIGDCLVDYSHYIRHAGEGAFALGRLKPDSKMEMRGLGSLMQYFLHHIEALG